MACQWGLVISWVEEVTEVVTGKFSASFVPRDLTLV